MAMGIIGFYFGVYLFSKVLSLGSSTKKAPAAITHEAPKHTSGDEIPSVDSAEFGEWLGKEGSIEKLLA